MALSPATRLLDQEARALLTRLDRLRPYALHMPMVPAAAVSPAAQAAIEGHMVRGRRRLRALVHDFRRWLHGEGRRAEPAEAQRRLTLLRLRFNNVITQFEIFADVLTQRSEHQTGVWVAGLDDVAADGLELPGYYRAPPVVCYLDRGSGAAIRRARSRLPGGEANPVAVIRVPRERMVGSGIASSLLHEVGHQAAALLDLVNSLRPALQAVQRQRAGTERLAWLLWERWASEIVADLWAVAKLGIGATLGLLAVVSLPRAFVFRADWEDPHPIPWVRVRLSAALGRALYPHPQWDALARLWAALYPPDGLSPPRRLLLEALEATLPSFVAMLLGHRPARLRGRSLYEALADESRRPDRLAASYRAWGVSPDGLRAAPPTLAFAVIGQARADGRITPEEESHLLADLLTYWALRSALDTSVLCARQPRARPRLPASRPATEPRMSLT
jgi:hypothetical protein